MQLKLNLQFFASEKTEKATPRKREDERKKGKVVKSQDVNTAILLLFTLSMLGIYGHNMKDQMTMVYQEAFTEFIYWEINLGTVRLILIEVIKIFAKTVLPIMLVSLIGALAANLLQIGFLITSEPLKFDLTRLDPIQGAKRIFSMRAFVELLKSLFKIVLIGLITFSVIWTYKEEMMMQAFKTPETALSFFGKTTLMMGSAAIIGLITLAIFDYAYQRYEYEKNMRMSKQEVKDEYKEIEGDPLIRSKMREKQRQIAMQRMMSEVPQADVIITNPTHFAVALKYDEDQASAPYVVAKGVGYIAQKIKEVAKAHDIITVENRELARSLYETVEIGELIPEKFYQAVAEILAYVYRLEDKV